MHESDGEGHSSPDGGLLAVLEDVVEGSLDHFLADVLGAGNQGDCEYGSALVAEALLVLVSLRLLELRGVLEVVEHFLDDNHVSGTDVGAPLDGDGGVPVDRVGVHIPELLDGFLALILLSEEEEPETDCVEPDDVEIELLD